MPRSAPTKASRVPGQIGRPSIYSDELALDICRRVASGECVTHIYAEADMPHIDTVMTWAIDGRHGPFSEAYARAKRCRAEIWAEQLRIVTSTVRMGVIKTSKSDGTFEEKRVDMVERSRLEADALKFPIARHDPERYGDRRSIDLGVREQDVSAMSVEEIRAEIDRLLNESHPNRLQRPIGAAAGST